MRFESELCVFPTQQVELGFVMIWLPVPRLLEILDDSGYTSEIREGISVNKQVMK